MKHKQHSIYRCFVHELLVLAHHGSSLGGGAQEGFEWQWDGHQPKGCKSLGRVAASRTCIHHSPETKRGLDTSFQSRRTDVQPLWCDFQRKIHLPGGVEPSESGAFSMCGIAYWEQEEITYHWVQWGSCIHFWWHASHAKWQGKSVQPFHQPHLCIPSMSREWMQNGCWWWPWRWLQSFPRAVGCQRWWSWEDAHRRLGMVCGQSTGRSWSAWLLLLFAGCIQ